MSLSLALSDIADAQYASLNINGMRLNVLDYSKRVVEYLSLLTEDELKSDLIIRKRFGATDSLLAHYLIIQDVMDWKTAAVILEYCEYDVVREEIYYSDCSEGEHERAISRLHYLKNGDV